ncbi:MAG: acetate kinase [Gimesia sp.]|uniref:Acetate kinase n=1 Tax=Gimesia maris TaxID=122 RepID=A0A3D3RDL2_9PLAN|nr:acetate kinase [Gimesia sp.]HCO26924.1 acetate kinase [Gimesia maris]|tara:strand:- start:302 stop:1501 length:1200 start_codon:yes stop_codon:yes gene_type:complete
MSILVLNTGSSTLKFALFDELAHEQLARGVIDWQSQPDKVTLELQTQAVSQTRSRSDISNNSDAVKWILHVLADTNLGESIRAVGHRIVHGGTNFCQPTLINEQVLKSLEQVSELAPLHNPPALITIKAAQNILPEATHVAVFDTAFFADLPPSAYVYPIPYKWYEQYGIRRFGFHGISHEYCSTRAAEVLGRQNDDSLRLVICHLGNGCSATAVHGGRPLATTMGFTPLEGLMMGTRSGSIDPGILIYLMTQQGFDPERLDQSLNHQSGLLGVSGISSDFRQIEQASQTNNERAQLAMKMFIERIQSTIGSLAVLVGGIDGLVFTAGIGEHSPKLRSCVCDKLPFLGLKLDEVKNQSAHADCDLATIQSAGRILLIQTREEQMIARETERLFELSQSR